MKTRRFTLPCVSLVLGAASQQALAQDFTYSWAKRLSGIGLNSDDRTNGIAMLEDGMAVVVGHHYGTLQIGSPPPYRGYVSFHRASDGTAEWTENFADASGDTNGNAVANAVAAGLGLALSDPPDWPDPPTFSTGWFSGDIDFGSFTPPYNAMVSTGGRDAYIARMVKTPGGSSWTTNYIYRFGGSGNAEGLAISVGPYVAFNPEDDGMEGLFDVPDEPGIRKVEPEYQKIFVAVGGFFIGTVVFGNNGDSISSNGSEDAFVSLLNADASTTPEGGDGDGLDTDFLAKLRLGGTGADRVTGIAVDQVDQAVVVTGFFSESVQFNPDDPGNQLDPIISTGGKDWTCPPPVDTSDR